jgi:hypothetical protein
MGFLSPVFLALGAAVVVPLIIHLFQRHQGPRVVFPAVRYLRRAETEHARRIKLRQLLLMLMRIVAILLLAIAAARPFLSAAGTSHQPSAVVIVLDNSMSASVVQGDRRVLDELKDRALETIGDAEAEDLFWLIRAGAPWEPALPGDATTTARRIRETVPTGAAADLIASLERARAVLEAGADGRATEIHLLSDLQATNLATRHLRSDWPPILAWIGSVAPPPNIAITAVDIGGGVPPIAGQRSTVAGVISGDSAADSVNVRLAIDGRVVAAAAAPTGSATILPFPSRPAGYVSGWIEKDPDAVRGDDRRWFATRVAPPPGVFVGADLGLVEEAIVVLERAGRVTRTDSRTADVALLPAGRGIENIAAGRGVVVLPPDSALELPATNRRLSAAGIPWQFEAFDAAGELRLDSTSLDGMLRTISRVRVLRVYRLTPQAGANADSALLRTTDGMPWAVHGTRAGGGRYVVFASPLSTDATTLPTSAALLPLLDRLLGAWIASAPAIAEAAPGQEIALPAGIDAVTGPDGIAESVSDGFRLGPESGVYTLVADDTIAGMIAANPPPLESDLTRVDASGLRAVLPGAGIVTADRPEQWRDRIFQERVGREVWRLLVLLAVLLLIAEAFVAATGSTTRASTARARTAARQTAPAGD